MAISYVVGVMVMAEMNAQHAMVLVIGLAIGVMGQEEIMMVIHVTPAVAQVVNRVSPAMEEDMMNVPLVGVLAVMSAMNAMDMVN